RNIDAVGRTFPKLAGATISANGRNHIMLLTWWRRLAQRNSKVSQRRSRQGARNKILRSYPRLEPLEDRLLLSTVQWTNSAGGDWDVGANWNAGHVPGADDEAVIDISGITVTHKTSASDSIHSLTSHAAINLSAGSLSLGSLSSILNTLTMTGGTLSG